MSNFRSAMRVRGSDGKMKDVLVVCKQGGGENITYPVADEPVTMGQRACLARAAHLRDVELTPVANWTCLSNTYAAGTTVKGIPYSSTRKTDNFIGYNVSLHTFMTALHNPRSVLYTKQSSENLAKTWYGLNCTVYVSYCWGLPYHSATAILPFMDCVEEVAVEDMRLCDAPVASTNNGGTVGHAVLITGIERDRNGAIQYVTISHCTAINADKQYTYAERLAYETFYSLYVEQQGYKLFRYKNLWNTAYTPSEYVPQGDEPTDRVAYSDLCTDLGDKATLKTGESITLQPLVTNGYTDIVLYKGTEVVGSYAVGDVTLTDLAAGKYTAKMGDAETSFIVADVSVSKDANRYTFAGDGTPLRVVFKNANGYTLHAVDLTEDDIANGYIDIVYTDAAADHICVPFKNEYGFVVARCDYTVTDPNELPSTYQKVDYIETSGGQYIDTGVKASNHADGISYAMKCNISGLANEGGTNYLFGANANSSRSGNIGLNTNNDLVFICGGNGNALRMSSVKLNKDIEITLTATSADVNSAKPYLDGVLFNKQGDGVNAAMPAANIYLMAVNGVDTARSFMGKLYSFTMTAADGTPLRDFVPCYRKADGVIGLYDTIGGVFYENQGTGVFAKGADV